MGQTAQLAVQQTSQISHEALQSSLIFLIQILHTYTQEDQGWMDSILIPSYIPMVYMKNIYLWYLFPV